MEQQHMRRVVCRRQSGAGGMLPSRSARAARAEASRPSSRLLVADDCDDPERARRTPSGRAFTPARTRAAKELGIELIWRGPLREDDRDSQVSEIEGFISRGVSGIAIAPLDEAALVGPVNDAMGKKIPVVIFDSGLKGDNYVSFVATDNFKGGQLGGERLIEVDGRQGARSCCFDTRKGTTARPSARKGFSPR